MAESSLSYDLAWSEGAVVTAETSRGGPIKLAIVDCELVVAGVTTMLADRRHRVRVVEPGPAPGSPFLADVVLYDPDGPEGYHRLHRLVDDACARVVVFSWSTDAGAIDRAMLVGAAGYLFKGVAADELASAVVAASRWSVSGRETDTTPTCVSSEERLTPREGDVLRLVARGMTNVEIAADCFLTVNSVKTYLRHAYRKIGVTSRSQAVRWALESRELDVPAQLASGDPR